MPEIIFPDDLESLLKNHLKTFFSPRYRSPKLARQFWTRDFHQSTAQLSAKEGRRVSEKRRYFSKDYLGGSLSPGPMYQLWGAISSWPKSIFFRIFFKLTLNCLENPFLGCRTSRNARRGRQIENQNPVGLQLFAHIHESALQDWFPNAGHVLPALV